MEYLIKNNLINGLIFYSIQRKLFKINAGLSILSMINKFSKFKNGINVYGTTESKKVSNNYKNIKLKKFYQSSNKYLKSF